MFITKFPDINLNQKNNKSMIDKNKTIENIIQAHRKILDKYILKKININMALKNPKKLKEVKTYEGGYLKDENDKILIHWTNPEIKKINDKFIATFEINNQIKTIHFESQRK